MRTLLSHVMHFHKERGTLKLIHMTVRLSKLGHVL